MFATGAVYQKPKLFIILMLFHMRYTRECLLFVLLLSLATIKNTFCNLVLLITQGEGDIIAITVQYSNFFETLTMNILVRPRYPLVAVFVYERTLRVQSEKYNFE